MTLIPPQPDWNGGYQAIKDNKKPDEIVIGSHPHFNKIFLNEPGYWLKYDYLGFDKDLTQPLLEKEKSNKEYYVGAEVINNLEEFIQITQNNHGYIIFDYMAQDGRIAPEILDYIYNHSITSQNMLFEPIFQSETNYYSRIWVYKF